MNVFKFETKNKLFNLKNVSERSCEQSLINNIYKNGYGMFNIYFSLYFFKSFYTNSVQYS